MSQIKSPNFQEFVGVLCQFWKDYDCVHAQPYDLPMGAGTFHPHTFLKGLGPEPWRSVYVQPCRRPVDGRYGKSTYRFQHYYQLQVLLKPSPANIVDIFLKSLEHVGIRLKDNDVGLLEDDWKGPTLGAWGLGWEVRANGQEVTQFTYFQQLGGIDVDVVCGEITYGLERLYMYAYGIKNALEIPFNDHFSYGDIFFQNEFEFSYFNFREADISELMRTFEKCEETVGRLCDKNIVLPAYDYVLQASHAFNLLDARGAISSTERQRYIGRVRDLSKKCSQLYLSQREKLGFPLKDRLNTDARRALLPKGIPQITTSLPRPVAYQPHNSSENRTISDMVFELGVEEMPHGFQMHAREFLPKKVQQFLDGKKSQFQNQRPFLERIATVEISCEISARRIAFCIKNLPEFEPPALQEIWGPPKKIAVSADGSWTAATLGFCQKNQIPLDQIVLKQRGNSEFIFFEKKVNAINLVLLTAHFLMEILLKIEIPLKMKWLPKDVAPPFIRPVRWILCLVEDQFLPLSLFGLDASHFTFGQRVLSPDPVVVEHASQYKKVLEEHFVQYGFENRVQEITNKSTEILKKKNAILVPDEFLIQKCSSLYENPYVFFGAFQDDYLRLPRQLIQSVLREHMNYFSVCDENTKEFRPYFIGVAHYKCAKPENMVQEAQDVVTGRLDDGAFYYDSDLKTPLTELREALKNQIFQVGMGTLFEKLERMEDLCDVWFQGAPLEDSAQQENVRLACTYAKADLRTGCVQEFPDEMQGVMGGILFQHQNICENVDQSAIVAAGISEHYLPVGMTSSFPSNVVACYVSLFDKLDSLCQMIAHGVEMKATKDPLGMRRTALSVLRLLGLKGDQGALDLSLSHLIAAWKTVARKHRVALNSDFDEKIKHFMGDRLKSALKDSYDAHLIEVLDPFYFTNSLAASLHFLHTLQRYSKAGGDTFYQAFVPYRRALNLTKGQEIQGTVQENLFQHSSEKNLYASVIKVAQQCRIQIQKGQYSEYLGSLSLMEKPLADFFENVMVNDPDERIRENRTQLLLKVREIYESVADFSSLQV